MSLDIYKGAGHGALIQIASFFIGLVSYYISNDWEFAFQLAALLTYPMLMFIGYRYKKYGNPPLGERFFSEGFKLMTYPLGMSFVFVSFFIFTGGYLEVPNLYSVGGVVFFVFLYCLAVCSNTFNISIAIWFGTLLYRKDPITKKQDDLAAKENELNDQDTVSMVVLCHALDDLEVMYIRAMLQSAEIPFEIIGENFGSLYPGIQIASYNERRFLVSEEHYEDALEIVQSLRAQDADESSIESSELTLGSKIRIVLETLAFGWSSLGGAKKNAIRVENNDAEKSGSEIS